MRALFGKLAKRGWWAANVDPSLNPEQVLELLERDADWHPAIPRIRTIVRGWLASRGRRDEYRCGRCMDAGWVFSEDVFTVEGNKSALAVRRCPGMKGPCRAWAWKLEKARAKRETTKVVPEGSDEFE